VNLTDFAASVKGEFVAGCLIATVDGKRQYLYRNGEFTLVGHPLYLAWDHRPKPEPDVAIAIPQPELRHKRHKSGR
jgi:hypothetical protein